MPLPVSLPEGYRRVAGLGAWGFARGDAAPWLEELLRTGETAHAWSAREPLRRRLTGRGATWAVPAPVRGPGSASGWVVRHYHRGGAMARVLVDRYVAAGAVRPLAALRASLEVARRGIPTPAVVAGLVYPAPPFYRADLVTEEIPGGVDLARVRFGGGGTDVAPGPALAAAGALVRRLGAAGVRHADLSAGNIVLERVCDGVRAWVVDLDGCRFGSGGGTGAGDALLRRLERSLRKLGRQAGRPWAGT
ncbi:MAG: hypothetical protein FIA95_06075 [Gemmatimonadetes bacterium]|nr:hypothetical protein [Gemmatimonadota bacterium]